jgi:hypothetical protein
VASQQFW